MDFIHYSEEKIDWQTQQKKYVMREWSFVFDTLLKVFTCRKIGWDHISYHDQKLAYSLAHGQQINVGKLILKELVTRLGKSPAKRGNEIFIQTFIQFFLNFKNDVLIELPRTNRNKIRYSKSMSKVLFGTLDAKNQVDVPLEVTPHMKSIFEGYPLDQPIYHSLSAERYLKVVEVQNAPNPYAHLSSAPLVSSEPTTLISQKVGAYKKKKKKTPALEPTFNVLASVDEA